MKGRTILAVDDEAVNLDIYRLLFEEDFEIHLASCGEEALARAAELHPDLLLLDVMMPDMSGYDVCRRLREDPSLGFAKILLVSARAAATDRIAGYEAGADDYVTKPFCHEELRAKVEVFLKLKSVEQLGMLKTGILTLLSHETRTPLYHIAGSAELMASTSRDISPKDIRQWSNVIADGAHRLLRLIERGTMLTQLQTGAIEMNLERFDLVRMVRDSIAECKVAAAEKHVDILLEAPDEAIVVGDERFLAHVPETLLDNAIRFQPEGTPIEVEIAVVDGGAHTLRVTDRGKGLDENSLQTVFDGFVVTEVLKHDGGHGLSLALCDAMLRASGGSIAAASKPGAGASFTATFPVAASEGATPRRVATERAVCRSTERPIDSLISAAQAMANGDMSVSILEGGDDELTRLASALNRMASRIQALEANVQQHARRVADAESEQEELRLLNGRISEFLANMSHEIRTPMNGVVGMTGLLLDTPLNSEQRDYVQTVRSSAGSLLGIINDILDFSKIENGDLSLEVIDFDLRDTVENVADDLGQEACRRGLELCTLIPTSLNTALRGDPGRLRQVVLNLMGNSLKFTERGEVVTEVSLVRREANGNLLRFEVRDTGIGIDAETQEGLFRAFAQADASVTRKYGGTGLGLSISKQLVELMGGEIGVESVVGEGSTFWFTVRLPEASGSGAGEDPVHLAKLATRRMLLVSDNRTLRDVVEDHLAPCRVRLDAVESQADVLGKLQEAVHCGDPYAVVMLDSAAESSRGLELAAEIKESPDLVELKLALLAFVENRSLIEDARSRGIDAVIRKPIRRSRLREGLASIVEGETDFDIDSLPAAVGDTAASTVEEARVRHEEAARILVVDDNVVNRKVARGILEKLGHSVETAGDGIDAMDALSRSSFDVILMDCNMPRMDGFESTREIRALDDEVSDVPIVAMTGNASPADRQRCIEAGMNDHIVKPIDIRKLTSILCRWIDPLP